ncbi:hypothetical protein EMIHUDRAFT_120657 [Emiliania huxleyi CCMP1516]|uniref:Cation/H+ exchanger transmembrane domain-containing protein n=4 Tax=Emiliania huxleyi TaxID=2903 RepID=A0A0D3IFA3_EMIH1|nr:hypothetical protein EMIHUDRAFT_120657 [Emiliania huxleyi CCMP1516]EOD09938.1 hypothetical protein EMIHUDRAFT_120657 [Emiliania huxleyi CCMP1516]|eukprot:XP_005762367.1 hypothetical protein EMIHUDRAFT_120657 [Emiliania huxleyi CCMP1516]
MDFAGSAAFPLTGGLLCAAALVGALDAFAPRVSGATGLPLITVHLLAGAAARAVGWLTPPALAVLAPLHTAALGVISIAAGAELEPSAVRQSGRVIGHLAVANCASALAFVFCCSYVFIGPSASIGLAAGDRLAAASLLSSVVAIARSPSSAIALVAELRADGPFTQTLLGVTMVTDLLAVVLFAICAEAAQEALAPLRDGEEAGRAPLALACGVAVRMLVQAAGGSLPWVEPMLACMVAGVAGRNADALRAAAKSGLTRRGSMELGVLRRAWPAATAFFAARLGAIAAGTAAGAASSGAPQAMRRFGWLGFVTQAGVSLGLVDEIGARFEWAAPLQSALAASIVLNQLVGPPMLKLALRRSGETDALAERGEPLLGQRLADTATPEVAMAVMASAAAAASEIGSSVAEAYGAALDSYAPRRD